MILNIQEASRPDERHWFSRNSVCTFNPDPTSKQTSLSRSLSAPWENTQVIFWLVQGLLSASRGKLMLLSIFYDFMHLDSEIWKYKWMDEISLQLKELLFIGVLTNNYKSKKWITIPKYFSSDKLQTLKSNFKFKTFKPTNFWTSQKNLHTLNNNKKKHNYKKKKRIASLLNTNV